MWESSDKKSCQSEDLGLRSYASQNASTWPRGQLSSDLPSGVLNPKPYQNLKDMQNVPVCIGKLVSGNRSPAVDTTL